MNVREAEIAANETPEGTQVLFAEFSGEEGFYPCTYLPDIVYAEYGSIKLKLQIIKPFENVQKFPLIVYVQGSAWRKQELYTAIPSLSHVASRGYVIASVEIRNTDIAKFPSALEDVKCAVRFMRENADNYGVDPTRVAVWGDSSGGHLALMTGLTAGEYNNGLYKDQSDEVSAVVAYYGVTDIPNLGRYNNIFDHDSEDSPEGLFLGGRVKDNIELAKKASPIYMDLWKKLPPFLIVHGTDDEVVHVNQSIEMYKALKEHKQNVFFYKVIGAGHGPGIWSPQILKLTEKFLSTHIKRPSKL